VLSALPEPFFAAAKQQKLCLVFAYKHIKINFISILFTKQHTAAAAAATTTTTATTTTILRPPGL